MKKMVFIIPPTVELLDLSGPAQVFTEAKEYGMELEMELKITITLNILMGNGS